MLRTAVKTPLLLNPDSAHPVYTDLDPTHPDLTHPDSTHPE